MEFQRFGFYGFYGFAVLQSIWGVSMACLVRFWVVWEILEAVSYELWAVNRSWRGEVGRLQG